MGRYTVNDNKSMQCNPNNERYWSSRGYSDDDDDEDYLSGSSFSYSDYLCKLKERLDLACVDIFGKRAVFRNKNVNDYQHPVILNKQMLFNEVLQENYSKVVVSLSGKDAVDFIDKFRKNIHVDSFKENLRMFKYKFVEFEIYSSESYLIVEFDRSNQGAWLKIPSDFFSTWFFKEGQEDNILNKIEDVLNV